MGEAWDSFVDGIREAGASVGTTLGEWVPKIIVALLILIVGRWLLRVIRSGIEKILMSKPAQAVFDRAGVTQALAPSETSAASLVASVVYAFLLLFLFLIVFQVLEIDTIVDLFERLIAVLPLIFVAVLIVLIAAAVANFVADLVRPYAEQRQVGWLPTAVRVIILIGGALAALDLLSIQFAEDIVKIVVAALGIALAVAFGVGGIDTAKKWWEKYATPSS